MNKVIIVLCLAGLCTAQYGASKGGGYQSRTASPQYSNAASQYSSSGSSSGGYSSGGYQGGNQYGRQGGSDYSEPAKYEFKYDVNVPEQYLEFGHQEQRDGDNTQGVYYVLLPDGRRQMVEYTVDSNGYHPKITYTGGSSGNYGSTQGNYPSGGYEAAGPSGGSYQGRRSQTIGYQPERPQTGYQSGRRQTSY